MPALRVFIANGGDAAADVPADTEAPAETEAPVATEAPTQAPAEATPVPAPAEKKTTKTTKQEKTIAEKMLDNFTRSTASGAGYSVGRTISRGILGVFGIK